MTEADPRDARIAELEATVAELKGMLTAALGRIGELERKLAETSQNSSRPPSSDGPGVQREPKAPTGRKPGGQPGHKGHSRMQVAPERVDAAVEVKPAACGGCAGALVGEDTSPQLHQVVEVPPLTAHVTEYRLHRLSCAACGQRTRAQLPKGVPRGNFGPRLVALAVLLTGRFRLSKREARELLSDALGVELSVGSVSAMEASCAHAVTHAYDEALEAVRASSSVHADETGWREARAPAWLWTGATPRVSAFRIAPARSGAEAKRLLGEDFGGVTVSDRFAGYAWVDVGKRQVCWAHLVRDFRALSERDGAAGVIGAALLSHAVRLFDVLHRVQDGRIEAWTFQRYLSPVKRDVGRLLRCGAALPDERLQRFCAGLLKLEPALWRFARLDGVEATNNRAERALRPAVLWRKGSFGTHSPRGSRFVERMLTVSASLRAQGRSVLAFLRESMTAALMGTPGPSLLPAAQL